VVFGSCARGSRRGACGTRNRTRWTAGARRRKTTRPKWPAWSWKAPVTEDISDGSTTTTRKSRTYGSDRTKPLTNPESASTAAQSWDDDAVRDYSIHLAREFFRNPPTMLNPHNLRLFRQAHLHIRPTYLPVILCNQIKWRKYIFHLIHRLQTCLTSPATWLGQVLRPGVSFVTSAVCKSSEIVTIKSELVRLQRHPSEWICCYETIDLSTHSQAAQKSRDVLGKYRNRY